MPQAGVLPAAPRVRLEVTQEIIDTSCRADSSHCMVADAVRQAAPWARNITVDIQTIRFSDPERDVRYVYLTPRIAQLALLDFDAGIPSEPFSVVLQRSQAHVSWMRRGTGSKGGGSMNEAQLAAVRKNMAHAREVNPKNIAVRDDGDHERITRSGGKTPPVGPLATGRSGRTRNGDVPTARRRTYGLRAMDRRGSE